MDLQAFDVPTTREQTVSFTVRMVRPDRVRPVVRHLFARNAPKSVSVEQLAGYLTHTLFADNERGGAGTLYHVTARASDGVDGFTVRRTSEGKYVHV